MRRFRKILTATAASAIAFTAFADASFAARPVKQSTTLPSFRLAAVNEFAAAQPTATGKQLLELRVHDGKVYAGYGDYGANTGPITVSSYSPGASAFTSEAVSQTEAIYNLREINGKLFAPAIDPHGEVSDYAVGGPWEDRKGPGAWHVFDMVTLTGTDLWMVGSHGNDAVAWRSLDGGTTWNESLRVAPQSAGDYARFYFAGVLKGTLYVQAADMSGGTHPKSRMTTGAEWSEGPALLAAGEIGSKATEFNGKLVFHAFGHGYQASIKAFDGRRARSIAMGYDVEVANGAVYVLASDGTVSRTSDFRKLASVAKAPTTARALTATSQSVFVGTTTSELLVADVL